MSVAIGKDPSAISRDGSSAAMFSADRVVEDGVRVHRAARVRDAFDAKRRGNRSVGTNGQAAISWKTIHCEGSFAALKTDG